ncbi:MAG: hypothetical protein KC613_14670 [Myxococcales bacterium]|nr:hypothetical protein [Myxococcales bacterium]
MTHTSPPGPWARFWAERRREFLVSLTLTPVVAWLFGEALEWAEARPYGWHFADPVLAALGPWDVTHLTLALSWSSLGLWIARWSRRPMLLMEFGQLYALLMAFKLGMMALVPLYAPPDIIVLRDPYIDVFFYQGEPKVRDLMFSGHTAQPIALALLLRPGLARKALWIIAALVGACVMVQHVHYSIDVAAAPLFAWLAFKAHRWIVGHWRDPAANY